MGLVVLAVALGQASPGYAHKNSRIHLTVTPDARPGELSVQLRGQLRTFAPLLELPALVSATPIAYRQQRLRLLSIVSAHVTIYNAQRTRCSLRRAGRLTAQYGKVVIDLSYRCPLGELELRYDLLFISDPDHRVFAVVRQLGKEPRLTTLDARRRTLRFSPKLATGAALLHFLRLGVHHIFSGYDHILFLLALLLAAPLQARSGVNAVTPPSSDSATELRASFGFLLRVVSAFTIAHSLTLVAAALGWVQLPGRLVESAIALSIAWVGLENLLWPTSRHRFWLVFVFGLLHGFGFAHVLAETGLPPSALVGSLLAFNVGVELGQLAIVGLLAPAIHCLARPRPGAGSALLVAVLLTGFFGVLLLGGVRLGPWPWITGVAVAAGLVASRLRGYKPVLFGGSIVIIAFGTFWLLQRVLAVRFFAGALG